MRTDTKRIKRKILASLYWSSKRDVRVSGRSSLCAFYTKGRALVIKKPSSVGMCVLAQILLLAQFKAHSYQHSLRVQYCNAAAQQNNTFSCPSVPRNDAIDGLACVSFVLNFWTNSWFRELNILIKILFYCLHISSFDQNGNVALLLRCKCMQQIKHTCI